MKLLTFKENDPSKPKSVRFAQLVDQAGKPEMVTLWADPKKDKTFMDNVNKKRVATVVQKPVGTKKDWGMIGFHPQPFAAFMVFPKALAAADGTPIVGIKYELLDSSKVPAPIPAKLVKVSVLKPDKAIEFSFKVTVLRCFSQELNLQFKAVSEVEAKKKALAMAKDAKFPQDFKILSEKVINITKS